MAIAKPAHGAAGRGTADLGSELLN